MIHRFLHLLALSVVLVSGVVAQPYDPLPVRNLDQASPFIHFSQDVWDRYGYVATWEAGWRYRSGDDPAWGEPGIADTSWEIVSSSLRANQMPKDGWDRVGWFRLHVWVDSSAENRTLGIWGEYGGVVQLYWDGDRVADSILFQIPTTLNCGRVGAHVLAVRYELDDPRVWHEQGFGAGFFFRVGDYVGRIEMLRQQRSEQMFFTALLLAFGITHLMLFVFSPAAKSHLYFTAFLFVMAAAVFVDIQQSFFVDDLETAGDWLVAHRAIIPFTTVLFLRFLYSVFYPTLPKQFWILAALMMIVGVIIVLEPIDNFDYYVIMSTIITAEMVRVLVVATRKKKPGSKTFGIGFALVGIFSAYDSLLDLGWIAPIGQVTNAYYFGFFGMLVAMSVYLARDYAFTSNSLVEQIKRVQDEELARRLIEVDNERKTKELEDARSLQLSMLPVCQNDIPGIDICFHMTTATEVGGDYYDYRLEPDGSIVIAVGDATGHGMKAGTMVSIVKGLFITHPSFEDIPAFLAKGTEAIKQMRLGNLYMGLTIGRLSGGVLSVASAGMPPAYVHRGATGSIEEILIKAMPLGGPVSTPYKQRNIRLEQGDTVLFMTDGLPEMFNEDKDQLDYTRVRAGLKASAGKVSTEIVADIMMMADSWRGDIPQEDDVTLIVMRKSGDE